MPSANLLALRTAINGDLGQSHIVQSMHLVDPFGLGALDVLFVDQDSAPLVLDCVCERAITLNATSTAASAIFVGVDALSLFNSLANAENSPIIRGGALEGALDSTAGGLVLQGDVQLLSVATIQGAFIQDGVFTTATILLSKGEISQGAPIYGSGSCNSLGHWNYGGAAAIAFPVSGGLAINGATSAYAVQTGAGDVVSTFGGIPLTPANLDLPASGPPTPGFGGLAFVPGVGCFQQGNVTP